MPNRRTFTIPPINRLIKNELPFNGNTLDPFAGESRLATITNDLDPQYNTDYNMDALDFLRKFEDQSVHGVLFDPPYSPRQLSEVYKKLGESVNFETTQASFWSDLKDEISRVTMVTGTVISFGWNSMGMGKGRGFKIRKILIVPHGGQHNDTICVVETKHQCGMSQFTNKEDTE